MLCLLVVVAMERYVAVEGFPAAGKSELLSTLARFYPEQVVVLPELVRDVAESSGIDPLRERSRLTEGLLAAFPGRQHTVRQLLESGHLVVEESHLGVHAAYAGALGDTRFVDEFARLEGELQWPELYIRLEVPVGVSLMRQASRGQPPFEVGEATLRRMAQRLGDWHLRRRSDLVCVDAHRSPADVLRELAALLHLNYSVSSREVIPYLILLGRPASGKSELIQYLSTLPQDTRERDYHLGTLSIEDDFPILWDKFVEDDDWEAVGRGRLLSGRADENYYVTDDHVWPFLIRRLSRRLEGLPRATGRTVLVEFARGGPGAYRSALEELSPLVLSSAVILYVDVPYEESRRRNRARYDQARREGLLTHSVPEQELERTYREDDWHELAARPTGVLEVAGARVPYITTNNVPEPTTARQFAERYRPALDTLYDMWKTGRQPQA